MGVVMLQKTLEPIPNTVLAKEAESCVISDGTNADDSVICIKAAHKSISI